MKIIDLLNKIANNEELPQKIRYCDITYNYDNNVKDYQYGEDYLFSKLFKYITDFLDDEIEIIEETKIPNKLSTWFSLETGCENDNVQYANYNFESAYEKINEIIDYLNSKENKNEH